MPIQSFAATTLADVTRIETGRTSRRQFFFDERGPSRGHAVHYAYAPVTKCPVSVDEASVGVSNTCFGTVLRLGEGGYRCYATSRTADQKIMGITVWQSADGLSWEAVMLGQAPVGKGASNQIWFEGIPGDQSSVAGPDVVPLRDGRWRMYLWKHREGHLRCIVAESEDGLHWNVPDVGSPALYHPHDGGLWKMAEGLAVHEAIHFDLPEDEVLARKRLWSNDASHVYYNSLLDRYECYSVWLHPAIPDRRVDVDNAPGVHRLIQRRLSEDGLKWSDPELILMPDERDPWDLQFYFLNVQWHEDWLIGCLGHYRVEDGQQSMDTELCFSREGRTWHRPLRGAWIPRSPEGSGALDSTGIYTGDWIDTDDGWLCLYSATPVPHNSRRFEMGIMAARFRRNRFLGVATGQPAGGFMTEPLFPGKSGITVDADIRGWARAELCDAFGRKLQGFELMNSIPMSGDSETHSLRWNCADPAVHRHECVRVRFEMSEAAVYSVAF